MHIQDIYTFSRLWPQGIFRLYAVGCFQHSLASFPLFTQLVIIFTWFLDWLQGGSRLSVCVWLCVCLCVCFDHSKALGLFFQHSLTWKAKNAENENAMKIQMLRATWWICPVTADWIRFHQNFLPCRGLPSIPSLSLSVSVSVCRLYLSDVIKTLNLMSPIHTMFATCCPLLYQGTLRRRCHRRGQ